MNTCFVCGGKMSEYFTKHESYEMFGKSIDRKFIRCEHCGLVIDQTSYDMTPEERGAVNDVMLDTMYEHAPRNDAVLRETNRIKRQALFVYQVLRTGIIKDSGRVVDYGCATGDLAVYVAELRKDSASKKPYVLLYDRFYSMGGGYISDSDVVPHSFDAVISCAVFEHLFGKDDVDAILSLLNDHGILFLHTLVCEEVPQDPDWFYLGAAHVTFWTNSAMSHLYETYGYVGCAYNVESRMWLFFKSREEYMKLRDMKDSIDGTMIFSEHFIDYWKQKPYR